VSGGEGSGYQSSAAVPAAVVPQGLGDAAIGADTGGVVFAGQGRQVLSGSAAARTGRPPGAGLVLLDDWGSAAGRGGA